MGEDGLTLNQACATIRRLGRDVSAQSVRRWFLEDRKPEGSEDDPDVEGFAAQYARARVGLMDRWAEQVVEIPDESPPSEYNHARLRVDARKWLLSKLRPEQYGDHLQLAGPGGVPLDIRATVYLPDNGRDRPAAVDVRSLSIEPEAAG